MRRLIIAVSVLAAFPVAAQDGVDFDRGISVRAVTELIKASAVQNVSVANASPKRTVRWLPGYKDVVLQPGQTASEPFTLASTEIVENCTFDPRNGMQCRESFGRTNRETLRIVIQNRPQVPGPETFRVMLDGYSVFLWLHQVHQPYKYRREGNDLILTPAPAGAKAASPVNAVSLAEEPCQSDCDCPLGTHCNRATGLCLVEAP